MRSSLTSRCFFRSAIAIAASAFLVAPAARATPTAFSGEQVTLLWVDSEAAFPGRGLCIQVSPALPAGIWICLNTSNRLYRELTAALFGAHYTHASCTLTVDTATAPAGANYELILAGCASP